MVREISPSTVIVADSGLFDGVGEIVGITGTAVAVAGMGVAVFLTVTSTGEFIGTAVLFGVFVGIIVFTGISVAVPVGVEDFPTGVGTAEVCAGVVAVISPQAIREVNVRATVIQIMHKVISNLRRVMIRLHQTKI
ncbi:MAG: hypothetical protein BGO39_00215 [Chloroflexi bacterium 54-19]|nr:MAG: hypothetical protein BGO39_00215 [Chloroflexi bacterium 54-19]